MSQTALFVKICGLSTPETLETALDAGADMVGFVFFARSPRHIDLPTARDLGSRVAGRALKVALSVDATDAELAAIIANLAPDLLQLHGHETPERVAEVRARTGVPVMKALGIGAAADLARAADYAVADRLLFDAKPAPEASRPGGNGAAFDWSLLADAGRFARQSVPYLLSGGLTPDNVAAALHATGARGVDVSSGVESAPGRKDRERIRAFVARARGADVAARLGASREQT